MLYSNSCVDYLYCIEKFVLLIPNSRFIPPLPFHFGNHKFVSSICFYFVNKLICITFLDSTYKWYHIIFVFLWLTLLSVIISRSICLVANGIITFFFIAELYSVVWVYIHTHIYITLPTNFSICYWSLPTTVIMVVLFNVHHPFCVY